ncbi:N-acetyllactosaminide beta-1,3-N-acetylglucosaminyltransferase 2 [Antennarius striatus]|uniref:N-acetyllactosaminide beta-1,3-N-acetylglucosaminyltransferase 2 n=1 Tax=Antennarius striatus TaxID=241820 RepID=UPI0035B0D988
MGRCCKCNGRLLCMCLLPCMMTGHLLIYVMVSIFVTMSYTPPPKIVIHYIAPGISVNTSTLASHPLGPFWNLRLEDSALWNHLQHALDRLHNPVLRGNTTGVQRKPKAKVSSEIKDESLSDCVSCKCSVPQLDLSSLPEQMKAFVWSMHCRKYPLLINQPNTCKSNDKNLGLDSPMLIMAIKSQVGNFENRQAIRETWGRSGLVTGEASKKSGLVRTVFLLGRQDSSTGPHPDLKNLLELENQKYGDILQWDFRDTFFNLTLKDLLFWHWLQQHCHNAIFVFKGDDDVFVRTGALLDYLHKQWDEHNLMRVRTNDSKRTLDLFVGDVINNAMPNREPSTKYYIPEHFFKGVYPPYAGGGGVVYSISLAMRLKDVSERVHLFPIDDVYLGMCLHKLGLSPGHHPGFLTFDLPETDRGNPCAYKSVLLVHRRTPKEMLTLWKQLQSLPRRC